MTTRRIILALLFALLPAAAAQRAPRTIDRLSKMTPEERAKALAAIPPERRANIERRLSDFEKLPPAQQQRVRSRLEKLNALPPARQREVRQSMRDFNALPQDRKTALNQEMRRMQGMPNDERQSYSNTDGFKKRFSPEERKIMDNLSEIRPDSKP